MSSNVGQSGQIDVMLFTEPCCKKMNLCLSWWEDRNLHLLGNEGTDKVLMLKVAPTGDVSKPDAPKGSVEFPVCFCPFCGKHLQTVEDADRILRPAEP